MDHAATLEYLKPKVRFFSFLTCAISGFLIGISINHLPGTLNMIIFEGAMFCVALAGIVMTQGS